MYAMQHQLSVQIFPRSGSKRSNRPTTITEHAPLAQGPDNRGGANGQHRAQGKCPQPHDVTLEQARDTTAGGDKENLVHSCTGRGGSTQGDPTLQDTITGGSYHQEGIWPPTVGAQDEVINITPKSRT
jgi:hypothetical protein